MVELWIVAVRSYWKHLIKLYILPLVKHIMFF